MEQRSFIGDGSDNFTHPVLHANECVQINEHFFGKDYMTLPSVQAAFGFLYFSIFLLGLTGNTSVVLKVATNTKLQSARNMFLLNLMASDILLCFTAVPMTPVGVMMKRWIFGDTLCRLIPLCQAMSVIITSFSLAAISLDKYIHIIDCTKAPITLLQSLFVVVLIWLVALLVNVPLVLSFKLFDGSLYLLEFGVAFCGQFCNEQGWESETYRRSYGTVIMCVQFIIPMVIISFCYTRIMSKVSKDSMIQNKQFSSSLSEVQRVEAMQKRRRVNYVLITMVAAFVAAWLPLTLHNILNDYGQQPDFVNTQPYMWFLITHLIAMTTVVINPLLFFWLTRSRRSHRRGFWHNFCATTMMACGPFSALCRSNRRPKSSVSEMNSRSNGGLLKTRSTNVSCSDFDSYARVEVEPLRPLSKSRSQSPNPTINNLSKRPLMMSPHIVDHKLHDDDIDRINIERDDDDVKDKLRKTFYWKIGESVRL